MKKKKCKLNKNIPCPETLKKAGISVPSKEGCILCLAITSVAFGENLSNNLVNSSVSLPLNNAVLLIGDLEYIMKIGETIIQWIDKYEPKVLKLFEKLKENPQNNQYRI